MILLKILILNIFWYVAVFFGPKLPGYAMPLLAIAITTLNFLFYKPKISVMKYIYLIFGFFLYGLVIDSSLGLIGLIDYNQLMAPLWLLSLYIVFIAYYDDIFSYFIKLNNVVLFLIGAVAGVLAYYGGINLSGLELARGKHVFYYTCVFLSWGVFFPTSLRFYYSVRSAHL